MINRLSDSKFFNFNNKKYNYNQTFQKLKFDEYKLPDNVIMDRLSSFKGYKYPFVDGVIDAVKTRKIIPCDFSTPSYSKNTTGDIFINYKLPRSIFSLNGINQDKQIVTYTDLSSKGKYILTPQKEIAYYDIPDLILYHLLSAAYVQYNLITDPMLSTNKSLYTKVAESYALIVSKIIDNMFPIISTTNTGYDKVFFLCMVFCLQNMFGIEKEEAMSNALKSKFISNKDLLKNECLYYQTNKNFMDNCDYNTIFPLDNFCRIITEEYEFIEKEAFKSETLNLFFTKRMNKTAIFCLESASEFINMLIFGKASLGLYNDIVIKNYLQLSSYDIIKEIAACIKR